MMKGSMAPAFGAPDMVAPGELYDDVTEGD